MRRSPHRLHRLLRATVTAMVAGLASTASASFVTFESGQVRPLALAPDGTRLFAVNTPDDRLEVFTVGAGGTLTKAASVPVGLEPVAVAARSNAEVWVVNHLSDSVSVVDVASTPPRVVRTILTCDEPRDLVFAAGRAFVTTARRGQNCLDASGAALDPLLTTPSTPRALVQVFDPTSPGAAVGGTPIAVVPLFGDTPRALATDGTTVWAAVFHSGNRTTTVAEGAVCNGGAFAAPCSVFGVTMPGGLPAPNTNFQGVNAPETGLIVEFDPASNHWEDRLGRNWDNAVRFTLPDQDVFAIDATATPPVQTDVWSGVGTVLFNLAVNPASGKLYVTNGEARNEVRFEGPGVFGGSTVRGHLHEARVTVLDGPSVLARHLNKHIDYAVVPSPAGVKERSLSTPVGMAVSADGATLWVAAFGSSKVAVFDTAALESDAFVPAAADHVTVTGGGPSGLVLDEARDRLYVLTRFDNAISVIDATARTEVAHVAVHNPEPAAVRVGRRFLYDARATSSNGEASCAVCHVFGDLDSLAWDLGNPDDVVLNNPNPLRVADVLGVSFDDFHPMKGPMTTQSLRGMANHGPMHWRGDRTGGNDPGGDPLDEDAAFKKFNVAFAGLLGNDGPLSAADMQAFTDFILEVTYPPNPIRRLDNTLTADQQAGRTFFFGPTPSDFFEECNGCHRLDPAAGFFGTDGFMSFENEPQLMKIAHLRNVYQKVGMFGMPRVAFVNGGNNGAQGPQVRGFGFLHDGSIDTVLRFLNATVFNQNNPAGLPVSNPGGFPNGAAGDPLRRQVEAFVLAFDSNLAPVVGQQITLTSGNAALAGARIDLLVQRAAAGECELIVKGTLGGEARGWVRTAGGTFTSDRVTEAALADAALRAQAATPGQERTYTCVPPGSGLRAGVDRDDDGFRDGDERDAGTDPDDPLSFPGSAPVVRVITTALKMKDDSVAPVDPARRKLVFRSKDAAIVPPAAGSSADPSVAGATLRVHNAAGLTTDDVTVALPASGWTARGTGWQFVGTDPDGPVAKVVLRTGKLIVKGGRAAWTYTLDEAAQGRVAVGLTLGAGLRFCAEAPAKATGVPPSTARNDRVDRFVAQPRSPAPAACSGSPGGAFLDD